MCNFKKTTILRKQTRVWIDFNNFIHVLISKLNENVHLFQFYICWCSPITRGKNIFNIHLTSKILDEIITSFYYEFNSKDQFRRQDRFQRLTGQSHCKSNYSKRLVMWSYLISLYLVLFQIFFIWVTSMIINASHLHTIFLEMNNTIQDIFKKKRTEDEERNLEIEIKLRLETEQF